LDPNSETFFTNAGKFSKLAQLETLISDFQVQDRLVFSSEQVILSPTEVFSLAKGRCLATDFTYNTA